MSRFTQADLDARAAGGPRHPGTQRLSACEYRATGGQVPVAPAQPRPPVASKLGNEPTVYNGHRYDSKAEAAYAQGLDFQVRAGIVAEWKPHVVYELRVADVLITTYELDFWVKEASGEIRYIDVKGQRSGTPYALFTCKKRLMLACHGIEVQEIGRKSSPKSRSKRG